MESKIDNETARFLGYEWNWNEAALELGYIDHGRPRSSRVLTSLPVLATINFSLFLMVIAKADASSKRQAQLAALLRTVQLLPFTLTAARQAAHIRLVLEQAGAPIGPHDIQIAGTALAHGATLVTHNHHAFARVPGLLLTDWYID